MMIEINLKKFEIGTHTGMVIVKRVSNVTPEDAYKYISDPTNRQKVGGLLSVYMNVIK